MHPLAVVCSTVAVIVGLGFAVASASERAERRSSGHAAVPANAKPATPTPAGPRRQRTPAPARALPSADAGRLAAPACATYADALAGRFPGVVLARGEAGALGRVSQGVAAALLGLPVEVPSASLPERSSLDRALRRHAGAASLGPRITAYARSLGIAACG